MLSTYCVSHCSKHFSAINSFYLQNKPMKLHYSYANCADEAMKVHGGHATHRSHTLVRDKARIWNWQSGPIPLCKPPLVHQILFTPSLSTTTITSIPVALIVNHILLYAPNLYSHPVSAADTHIYNSPLTFPPWCPISLYTSKTQIPLLPQTSSHWVEPSETSFLGFLSFSPTYLVKHGVLMILPPEHLTLCIHFSQPSTVSFVVHIRSISLSGLLHLPPNSYELFPCNPFSILRQEHSLQNVTYKSGHNDIP